MKERLKSPSLAYDSGSGACSGPVRVSYFDPRTGEPCDVKPEPLHGGGAAKRGIGLDAVLSMSRPHNARPTVVDGVRYASVSAAAKAVGCSAVTLRKYLGSGAASCRGHAVAYAAGGPR